MRFARVRLALLTAAAVAAGGLCAAPAAAQLAQKELPEQVRGLDVIEQPGAQVPLDAALIDSSGRRVKLGDYFQADEGGKGLPVILALMYYDCPVACPAQLTAITQCINGLDYTLGEDFKVVVVSFDHTNTTQQALEQETYALTAYNRPKTPAMRDGIRFHTTTADEARRIADAVGFGYRYLPEVDEYGHASAIFILSPEGKVSRYMYGFQYPPGQMRLALLEASEGRIARSFGDKIMLFCYRFDPESGAYTVQAWIIMRVVGAITVIGLAALVLALKVYELRRRSGGRPRRRTAAKEVSPVSAAPALGGVRTVRMGASE
jgi:protein SCO1